MPKLLIKKQMEKTYLDKKLKEDIVETVEEARKLAIEDAMNARDFCRKIVNL